MVITTVTVIIYMEVHWNLPSCKQYAISFILLCVHLRLSVYSCVATVLCMGDLSLLIESFIHFWNSLCLHPFFETLVSTSPSGGHFVDYPFIPNRILLLENSQNKAKTFESPWITFYESLQESSRKKLQRSVFREK